MSSAYPRARHHLQRLLAHPVGRAGRTRPGNDGRARPPPTWPSSTVLLAGLSGRVQQAVGVEHQEVAAVDAVARHAQSRPWSPAVRPRCGAGSAPDRGRCDDERRRVPGRAVLHEPGRWGPAPPRRRSRQRPRAQSARSVQRLHHLPAGSAPLLSRSCATARSRPMAAVAATPCPTTSPTTRATRPCAGRPTRRTSHRRPRAALGQQVTAGDLDARQHREPLGQQGVLQGDHGRACPRLVRRRSRVARVTSTPVRQHPAHGPVVGEPRADGQVPEDLERRPVLAHTARRWADCVMGRPVAYTVSTMS